MKLLLTSAGVVNETITETLKKLLELGFAVDIVDISSLGKEVWLPRLEEAEGWFYDGRLDIITDVP